MLRELSANRFSPRNAFRPSFEVLEGRQLMSAAIAHAVDSVPALHASAPAPKTEVTVPLGIFVGDFKVDGKTAVAKYALTLLTDSNGSASARVGGNALGITGDVVLTGTHNDSGYSLKYVKDKTTVTVSFTLSDSHLSGYFSIAREGKTKTATFEAIKLPPPVITTDLGYFAGYVTLPTTGQKMLVKTKLVSDSAGKATLAVSSPILGDSTLTGTHNGNSYSFIKAGKLNLSLTLSTDKKTFSGTVTCTGDGKTTTLNASLSSNITSLKDPEPPAPTPAPKTDVVIGKFSGNIVLPGQDRKLASTITLVNTPDGKVVLCIKTPLLAAETRFLGSRDGNTFTFSDQIGNASFSFALTVSDDQKHLTGTMTRVAEGNIWPITIDFTTAAPAPVKTDTFDRYFTGTVIANGQKMAMNLHLTASNDKVTLVGKSPILGSSEVNFIGTRSFNTFSFSTAVGNIQLSFQLSLSADGNVIAGTLTRVAEGHTMDLDIGLTSVPTSSKK